ncbi:MAG TPA: hypothetical protein VMU14_20380, partial [Acidimicrobiales bacterium]|nr:hypothetical protein [Acidimicrobiales bacterium]
RITLQHVLPRKRIDVVGYVTVEAEGEASEPGDVRCGIPGFDHPGTELHGEGLRSEDAALRFEVRGRRRAAFATDFEYASAEHGLPYVGEERRPMAVLTPRGCRTCLPSSGMPRDVDCPDATRRRPPPCNRVGPPKPPFGTWERR